MCKQSKQKYVVVSVEWSNLWLLLCLTYVYCSKEWWKELTSIDPKVLVIKGVVYQIPGMWHQYVSIYVATQELIITFPSHPVAIFHLPSSY